MPAFSWGAILFFMKEVFKYSIWSGLFATLIIPFIVTSGMTIPYTTGKVFIFRILVEILLGLWLILIIKDKEYRPKFTWLLGSVGIFALITLIADIHASDSYRAFWGNFERMEGWLTIVHLFAYFLILGSMFRTERVWLWFFRAFVSLGFISALMGIVELSTNGVQTRVYSTFGNPIVLAAYFLFNFFVVIVLLYKHVLINNLDGWSSFRRIFKNWLFYAYFIIAGLSIYLIYLSSRGVLLGLIVGFFLMMILLAVFGKIYPVLRKLSFGGIILLILLAGTFISIRQTDFVKNNLTLSKLAQISVVGESGVNTGTDQVRQLLWPMALSGFKDKPILGWGQEGFNYVSDKYYDPKIFSLEQNWYDRAHSTLLDFLIAGGILGLLSYLSILGAAIYLLWSKKSRMDFVEKVIITGLLIGYFFQGLFIFDTIVSYILFFTILAYIHYRVAEGNTRQEVILQKNKVKEVINNGDIGNYSNYIFIPGIVILTLATVWYVNIPSILANTTFIDAIKLEKNDQISASVNQFKKALSYASFGDMEIRSYLLTALPADIIKSAGLTQEGKVSALGFVFEEAKKQIAATPGNARFLFYTGAFLNGTGNPAIALDYLDKAKDLAPNYQMIRFDIVKSLLALNKKSEALIEAKAAYDLSHDFLEARFLYAYTAAYNGQTDIADGLLVGLKTPFDKIKEVYGIEASEAYKANNKARAVAAIQKLIKINPDFKLEGETAISNIWNGTINFEVKN